MSNIKNFRANVQAHIKEQINKWMNPDVPEYGRQYYYQKGIVAPTVIIPRAGTIRTFEEAIDNELLWQTNIKNDEEVSVPIQEAKDNLRFDAILIHYNNKIRVKYFAEPKYANIPHNVQSNSKSLVGIAYSILVDRGLIQPNEKVTTYLPELKDTLYEEATVQQLVDMRINTPWNDWYSMNHDSYPTGESYEMLEMANTTINSGWHANTSTIEFAHQYLKKGSKHLLFDDHGIAFSYVSQHTNVAAMVIEAAADEPFHEFFAREVHAKIGAAHDATFAVNCFGEPAGGEGGFALTAMDMLRYGLALQEQKIDSPYLYQKINERTADTAIAFGKSKHKKMEEFLPVFGEYGITHYTNYFYLGHNIYTKKLLNFFLGAYGQVVAYSPEDDFVYVGQSSYNINIAPPILGHIEAANQIHAKLEEMPKCPFMAHD